MSDVESFRAGYRAEHIGRRYSGVAHFAVTATCAIAAVVVALSRVRDVTLAELAVVPAAFLVANVVEYLAHRFLMHVPRGPLRFLFVRHTLQHHRFFVDGALSADSTRDWQIVLFPPAVIVFFLGGIGVPLTLALGAVVDDNVGALFGATAAGYFLLYEVCHLAWHQPDDSVIAKLPGVRRFRAHHRAHHTNGSRGFNVTFPIADTLFRT
jgi:hypothetical protein